MKILCGGCGQEMEIVERVGFRQTCDHCGDWLHSCLNCRHWSGSDCREPAAEKTGDPKAQNYCDWYRGIDADSAAEGTAAGTKADAEEMWKKLTGKKQ